ncbi:MAG: FAD-dependent oxidoreductase, partial [Planctomycetota bacterium]
MIRHLCTLTTLLCLTASGSLRAGADDHYDVAIYGGSPSGLAAAIQAARLGSRVIVLEPDRHVGGMMAAGLTRSDVGDAKTTGGICREFFDRAAKHYDKLGVKRQSHWHFEPHLAGVIWGQMLDEAGDVTIHTRARLTEVQKDGEALTAAAFRLGDGRTLRVAGKVFIDATYEGDLAAEAGAPYLIGRESKDQFGEPHGLAKPDKLIQAYCFRLTVTADPENRIPIEKPAGYDPTEFDLLAEYVKNKGITQFVDDCLYAHGPVCGKLDGNAQWRCWVSTDWAQINADYPEGSWERREEIYREYKRRTLGFVYFLQHDPSVPEVLRRDALRWGLPEDEHRDTGHVPFMLYVREARRILGRYVFAELDATTNVTKPDSIGCGGYPI